MDHPGGREQQGLPGNVVPAALNLRGKVDDGLHGIGCSRLSTAGDRNPAGRSEMFFSSEGWR